MFNNISNRTIGDDSLLEEIGFDDSQSVIGPYEKMNWDGRRLKSISAVLREPTGKAVGVLCINLDVSRFDEAHQLLGMFLNKATLQPQPEALFKEDWQEKINWFVHEHLRQQNQTVERLSRTQKCELVGLLAEQGAFKGKHAHEYVARILRLSRATVYKYLNEHKD